MWNGSTLTAVYPKVLLSILRDAKVASPRGLATFEVIGESISLDNSTARTLFYPDRKLHLAFACVEALWNLSGQTTVEELTHYVPRMAQFSDDGTHLRSCYGARMFGGARHVVGGNRTNQLLNVARLLTHDPETRQAVVMFRYPQDAGVQTKDAICGTHIQFLIRENKLHAIFSIRSNDLWLGMPYDVFTFSIIQQCLADALCLQPGRFIWQAGSLHLYVGDNQFAPNEIKLHRIINSGYQDDRLNVLAGFPRQGAVPYPEGMTITFAELSEEGAATNVIRIQQCALLYYEMLVSLRKRVEHATFAETLGHIHYMQRSLFRGSVDDWPLGGGTFWRDLVTPVFLHWLIKAAKRDDPETFNDENKREYIVGKCGHAVCGGMPDPWWAALCNLAGWYWQPTRSR